MTRKQIAFRIDQDKAKKLSAKAKSEGRMLNAVLESLVDRYLEDELTTGNNEVTTGNNESEDAAIAALTEKVACLEKQLIPVSELHAVTGTDKEGATPTSSRGGGFGFAVQSMLPPVSSDEKKDTVSSELTPVNNESEDDTVSSELPSVNNESEDDTVSSELPSVNNESGDDTVSSELPSVNNESEDDTVSTELTPVNNESEDDTVSTELTPVNIETISQNKLATLYGVSSSSLKKIKQGKEVTPAIAKKVAKMGKDGWRYSHHNQRWQRQSGNVAR